MLSRKLAAFLFLVSCGTEGDDMALAFPPDGWVVENGAVWGTDIDESTSVVLSGPRSVHFLDTTPSAQPALISRDFIPVSPSRSYVGECEVQADSTSATNDVIMLVRWYQSDKSASAVTSQDIIRNVEVRQISTWETTRTIVTSPPDAAYAKVLIVKDNFAFNAYFDRATFTPAVPYWDAYRNAALTLVDTVAKDIAWDAESSADATVNTTTGVVTILVGGIYYLETQIAVLAFAGGQDNSLSTNISVDSGAGYVTVANGYVARNTTASLSIVDGTSRVVQLNPGDLVKVTAAQVSGANRSVWVGTNLTFFSGHRIE